MKKKTDTKPSDAVAKIKFLNSKYKVELEELNIKDRTKSILEVRKVLIKINIMLQLEYKCENLQNMV